MIQQQTQDLGTNNLSIDSLIFGLDKELSIEENQQNLSQQNHDDQSYDDIMNLIESIPVLDDVIEKKEIFENKELKIEENLSVINDDFASEILKINEWRKKWFFYKNITPKIKFAIQYVFISTFVFILLLWWSNFSAYSKLAYNFINPDSLKNSSQEIMTAMDNSRIKVYADEENKILSKEQEEKLQEKLSQDNALLKETYFSPKKLVPLKSSVNLDVEVLPFENRIVIPKIGKNIPLVDVDSRRWNLTFENLENIFMKELEKWIVRYPWTAKPWDNGNVFIFWHSSNYPWMKWDYNDVFALLDNVVEWDEIITYYNQKKYIYKVTEKNTIRPWDVDVLQRDSSKKEISLMTCWPVGTTLKRLIVFWELQEIK